MSKQWLIIGISGVTCGGKTTLANECVQLLPNIKIISQDDYFLPQDSKEHVYIPELAHYNWEILSSLDMNKMYADIEKIITHQSVKINVSTIIKEFTNWEQDYANKVNDMIINKDDLKRIHEKCLKNNINILLIEGFSIFNYDPIDKTCHFKFYLTLSRDICFARRSVRTYDPPDVPGYFENCVWPEHEKKLVEVQEKCKNVVFLTEQNGSKLGTVFEHLKLFFNTLP